MPTPLRADARTAAPADPTRDWPAWTRIPALCLDLDAWHLPACYMNDDATLDEGLVLVPLVTAVPIVAPPFRLADAAEGR